MRISILVACAALCAVATVSASAEKPAASERIIVPFELVGMSAEHHVIAWFGGHPDFGCVEAFDYGNDRARAILTRHDGSQIDVFGYEGADSAYDESAQASAVAKHLGTDHTQLIASPADALALVPRLAAISGEPFADASLLPTRLVA